MASRTPLQDEFDGPALDTSLWTAEELDGGTVAVSGGTLRLTVPAGGTSATATVYSNRTYDLTGCCFAVTVDGVATTNGNGGSAIGVDGNPQFYAVQRECNKNFNFLLSQPPLGENNTVIPYDGAQHLWRICHDAASDRLRWETSSDGGTWQTHRTEPLPAGFGITAVVLWMKVGQWGPGVSGTATIARAELRCP